MNSAVHAVRKTCRTEPKCRRKGPWERTPRSHREGLIPRACANGPYIRGHVCYAEVLIALPGKPFK